MAGHAVHADDAAPATLGHPRREGGNQLVGAANVGGEHLVEGGLVELVGRAEPRESGVVDQYVDRAHGGGKLARGPRLGQIGGNETGPSTASLDGLDRLGAANDVAAVHDHLVAVVGERQCGRLTDAGSGPGDQGDAGRWW